MKPDTSKILIAVNQSVQDFVALKALAQDRIDTLRRENDTEENENELRKRQGAIAELKTWWVRLDDKCKEAVKAQPDSPPQS